MVTSSSSSSSSSIITISRDGSLSVLKLGISNANATFAIPRDAREGGGYVVAMATNRETGKGGGLFVVGKNGEDIREKPTCYCDILGDGGVMTAHDPEAAKQVVARRMLSHLSVATADAAGRLWIGTKTSNGEAIGEVFCVENARKMIDGTLVKVGVANDVHEVGAVTSCSGAAFHENNFYIADKNVVSKYAFDPHMATLSTVAATFERDAPISTMAVDGSGNLWIATQSGDAPKLHHVSSEDGSTISTVDVPLKRICGLAFARLGDDDSVRLYAAGEDDDGQCVICIDNVVSNVASTYHACTLG